MAITPTARSASRERAFKRYGTTQQRQSWTCTGCGHHVHPTAGTIFHKSSTSLHLWFYAMYMMTSTRCGISAKQLERELGVTYKTAWRMFNLIRNQLMDPGRRAAVRRRRGGRDRRGREGRAALPPREAGLPSVASADDLGMVERGGRVRREVEVARGTITLWRAPIFERPSRPRRFYGRVDGLHATAWPLPGPSPASRTRNRQVYIEWKRAHAGPSRASGRWGVKNGITRRVPLRVHEVATGIPQRVRVAVHHRDNATRPMFDALLAEGFRVTENEAVRGLRGAAEAATVSQTGNAERRPTDLRRFAREAQKAGVSMSQIAREAGVSRQGLYDLLADPRPS